jgi:hypothetical protein
MGVPERHFYTAMQTVRLIAGVVLLIAAAILTWTVVGELDARRSLRFDLAEIGHVRYGLLNADRWVEKLAPILESRIDALDLQAESQASLRPMVQNALYRLLDDVKERMSKPAPQGSSTGSSGGTGGFFSVTGNPMVVNMIVGALRPRVPEFTDIVMRELGRPEARTAVKNYIRSALAEGAKNTFGAVDMTRHNAILQQHGCSSSGACQKTLVDLIGAVDRSIAWRYLSILGASALAFLVLLPGALQPAVALVLMAFCVVLLLGGILTPMLEVEAKITDIAMTFMGTPISFEEQILYYQSKSVLEVFRTLINQGQLDMWIVGVLVLMFSVVFPTLKLLASTACLVTRGAARNRIVRWFALESSKWSMADVMALAIFMAFVAFNGLIANTMGGLRETGAQIRIPTDSSKILPGFHLFVGFCLASLFLSRKLAKSLLLARPAPDRGSEEV